MKKNILFFVVILITQLTYAQKAGNKRFSLTISPTVSWMKSNHENVQSASSRVGYNFGVLFDNFFGDNYAFSTGLLINTTGGKLNYLPVLNHPGIQTQAYKLKYIEIPLGLKLRSEDIRRTNIYGKFGLSPQMNIQAHDRNNRAISDNVRLFDISYHLGGGIEYAINSKNAFMLGLQFNNGFADVTKHSSYRDKAILNRVAFEFGFIF